MKGSSKTFGCEKNPFPFKFGSIVVRNFRSCRKDSMLTDVQYFQYIPFVMEK